MKDLLARKSDRVSCRPARRERQLPGCDLILADRSSWVGGVTLSDVTLSEIDRLKDTMVIVSRPVPGGRRPR